MAMIDPSQYNAHTHSLTHTRSARTMAVIVMQQKWNSPVS